jgi:hypothetical protein
MRYTLVALALVCGCATTPYRYHNNEPISGGPCLSDRFVPDYRVGYARVHDPGRALYLEGKRVPHDDILVATADDERAHDLAEHSVRDLRYGIGTLISGGLLLGPGASLIGFGEDHGQRFALGAGAVITAVSGATLLAGVLLVARSERDRRDAVLAYNADTPPSCVAERAH